MKTVYIDFKSNYEYIVLGNETNVSYTKERTLNRLVVSNVKEVLFLGNYISIDYGGELKVKVELKDVRFMVIN